MDDEELRRWVDAWSQAYRDDDTPLDNLIYLGHFTREHIHTVNHWKHLPPVYGWRQYRRDKAFDLLRAHTDDNIRAVTATAFKSPDDWAALNGLLGLSGIGYAFASSILMAQDPLRFTVWDQRAVESIRAISQPKLGAETKQAWIEYLNACRSLARRTGFSLRDVDRALYTANGQLSLPTRNSQ